MRIHLASIFVDDQAKALQFYTEVLGFQEKEHVPVGDYETRSPSTTSTPSMSGSKASGSGSPSSQRTWGLRRPPCSKTPVGT
jgi:catechol 2,3-dioxygenase-like lactoylglutathione lyase family enzyme